MNYSLGNMLGGAGALNADKLSLDLQFATDKTLTARKGPTPVFTRASGATQVGASGLIEFAPENLILQSEDFSSVSWTKNLNAGLSFVANAEIAPNGTTTADKMLPLTDTGFRRVVQSSIPIASGIRVVMSVYAKADGYSKLAFRESAQTGHFASFDLNTASVLSKTTEVDASIISIGNGWFRISAAMTVGSNNLIQYSIYPLSPAYVSGTPEVTWTPNGTSGIFLWGAQLERYDSARTYIPTTTAAVYGARFDHDPITLACKGLLIEESRTNLALQSNAFSTSPWGEIGGVCTMSQNVTGVDGVANSAWTLEDDNITTTEGRSQAVNLTNATAYSLSVFIKKTTGTPTSFPAIYILLASPLTIGGCVINTTTGATTSINSFFAATILSSTNIVSSFGDFWKVTTTVTANSTASWLARILPSFNGDGSGALNGTSTGSAVFWGAQLEAGAFPTSYIPTTTASVVRSVDLCSITGSKFTSFYNQSEGTYQAAYSFVSGYSNLNNSSTLIVSSNSTFMEVTRIGTGTSSSIQRFDTVAANVTTRINSLNPHSLTSQNKVAAAYKVSDNAMSLNGAAVVTSSPAAITSVVNRCDIGANHDGTSRFNGHLAAVRYYRKRLANAKLVTLTT